VPGETRVRLAPDGHFWVEAQLNGETVRFLIDSGATTTSISGDTARRVGIEPSRGFPALVKTANGTVSVQRGRPRACRSAISSAATLPFTFPKRSAT
jgi:aspartyl protease family protein